jgi:uncharacterized protein
VKIDLSHIESSELRFSEDFVLRPHDLEVPEVEADIGVHLEGRVVRVASGFEVSGRCTARGSLLCSRCLEPVQWSLEEDFKVHLCPREDQPSEGEVVLEEDDLEVQFLEDESFDVGKLAAEQVLLGLPMRVVCEESCAGLCPRCGGNRNTDGECRCEGEVDPRWEGLKGLKGLTGSE